MVRQKRWLIGDFLISKKSNKNYLLPKKFRSSVFCFYFERVFNSWKKISVTEKVKKEQELHQNLIKVENIKIVKAIKFSNFKILSK
jgi:hypothetical protein